MNVTKGFLESKKYKKATKFQSDRGQEYKAFQRHQEMTDNCPQGLKMKRLKITIVTAVSLKWQGALPK